MNSLVLFMGIFVLGVFISSVAQILLKKSAEKEYPNKTLRVRKGDSTRNMKLEDLIEEVKSCLKKS